jgi:restriction system protein
MVKGIIWFILKGSLYLFSAIILYNTSPILSAVSILIGLIHLIFRGIRPAWSRMRLVRRTRKAVAAHMGEHTPVLARKRSQLVKKDDYGVVHYEDWEQEKDYFITTVLGEHFPAIGSDDFPLSLERIDAMIEKSIDGYLPGEFGGGPIGEQEREEPHGDDQKTYRQYCAKLLGLGGWKVLSGEEQDRKGSPILAERDGKRLVLTCINASSPVGRRAITRTHAARQRHDAHMAAVVSNAGFSRWARMGSSRYDVMPLHHEDLANI